MKKSAGAACCPHLPDICVHGGFRYETNMQTKPSAHSHRRAGLLRADSAARALRRGRGREKSAAGESPLEIVLWVLTAIAAAWIIASVWKLDGSAKYEDNFRPSLMAAVGHYIAAAGILLTVLLPWWMEGRLLLLRRVLGAASAVGLIVAGRCRRAGKCPLFLTHLAVCAFFVVHMLGNYGIWCSNPQLQDCWLDLSASALMALFAFYEAAFDVGLGRRRMQLATGLMAAYLGCAALSGSGYLILYFGCAVWALTDLCSLTPKPKQENAA